LTVFSQIGPLEIILVLAIALIVLGPKRLPDAGRSIGRGIRNFKAAVSGDDEEDDAKAVEERKSKKDAEEKRPIDRTNDGD
jgi:sec-independent protein translocase protein TatA